TSGGDFNAREGAPFPLGGWQLVAFTAGGGVLRLFRNGQLVASSPYTGTFVAPSLAGLGIGVKLNTTGTAADTGAPGFWQGRLDELAIWNRALATNEIQAMAGAVRPGLPVPTTDLRPA